MFKRKESGSLRNFTNTLHLYIKYSSRNFNKYLSLGEIIHNNKTAASSFVHYSRAGETIATAAHTTLADYKND